MPGLFIGAIIFDITGGYRLLFTLLAGTYLTTALILLCFVRPPPLPVETPPEDAHVS